jgi:hypothetical protein
MTDEKKIKDEELANITGAGAADLDLDKKNTGVDGTHAEIETEGGGGEHPGEISQD